LLYHDNDKEKGSIKNLEKQNHGHKTVGRLALLNKDMETPTSRTFGYEGRAAYRSDIKNQV
jgi:hypothetical protein